ncbi:MAG: PP2C family protein-serine/threonine phosphatase [Cytophagales bacterium]|nr:PP2C family protein-serine/threonine phosphatase [Cytophagales bacterium]
MLHLKQLELNSLLELTQAINNNLPEESLYKIFHFTIRAHMHINKLSLFVHEGGWANKVEYGVSDSLKNITVDEGMFTFTMTSAVETLDLPPYFNQFEKVIPILHKKICLAYIFIGGVGIENENNELLRFIETFSNILLVAIENKKFARSRVQQEVYKNELEIARKVQSSLFPKTLPNSDKLKVHAMYLPHQSVGGDYFDFIPITEQQFLFCIADVSGKGVPAAIVMSNFQASLRVMVRQKMGLIDIISELNRLIYENMQGMNFITSFMGVVDLNSKLLVYVNSGHNPPLIACNGAVQTLEKGSTVLGAFEKLPFLNVGTMKLYPNTYIFCYTDGLSEIKNLADEEIGSEFIRDYFVLHYDKEAQVIHEELIARIDDFRQNIPYSDDITLLSLKIQ